MKKCTDCIHIDVCNMHCEQQKAQGCCDCMMDNIEPGINVSGLWWADLNQTIRATKEFKEV